ncbi:MAG TPA: hypothetical protein VF194_02940 [Ferrovibrio sp.]|uniref:hypothetical protein n=1 Tax=Ferrovibrio sp. TaxID=1917215 RepID=UPI002ED5DE2B
MSDLTAIIPRLPVERATVAIATGGMPKSRIEVITEGALPGAETMLQKLLEIRGKIGGPDKERAERESRVPEFHAAPITYDGFAVVRRPPAESIRLVTET